MTHLAFIDTETTGLNLEKHDIWELALIVRGHPNPDKDGDYVWQFPITLADADPMALDISGWYGRSVQWRSNGGDGQESGVRPDRHFAWSVTGMTSHMDPALRQFYGKQDRTGLVIALLRICDLVRGAHLVGAVPDFDAYRLRRLLAQYGLLHTWHYHLIDIEALMVGYLHGKYALQEAIHAQLQAANGGALQNSSHNPLAVSKLSVTLPWKSDDLSRACGVDPPANDERHTALGDARWAERVFDMVTEV